MSGFTIRNKGLRDTFAGMLSDNKVTKQEVQTLLDQAQKDGKISGREKADLKRILSKVGDSFDADARADLKQALGLAPEVGPGGGGGGVQVLSDKAASLTDIKAVAGAFSEEVSRRGAEFSTPEKAFALFSEYAGKLRALAGGQDPRAVDAEVEKLLKAGRGSPAAGYDRKDADLDTLSDMAEVAMGRDANKFEERVMGADSPAWTTTYWPSAGSGDMDQAGSPGSNLWAKEGPLGKLDKLLNARGMGDRAKALEFERKPMLTWLIGDRSTAGHFVPNANLKESDAEMTTGVDFDGDGKLSKDVKVDFIDQHGNFSAVWGRDALKPKLGDETLTRKTITDAQGAKSFEFFHADGRKLAADEVSKVFYANPSSDGKVEGTMNIGWWGYCDQVALAGILFKEPMKASVTVDGVTFTKQDMLGLLTTIASSQARGTDFAGARYNGEPDTVRLKNGKTLQGKLETSVEFRTSAMRREGGDTMVLSKVDTDLKFRTPDGTVHDLKAADVVRLTREDEAEMSPMDFHKTVIKWLGEDKRAAVMDRDAGSHVWNYNFWKATVKEGKELTGTARPTEPGFNGPADANNKVVQFEMEVLLGTSTSWGNDYKYWLELDKQGNPVNGGWQGTAPPDFMWRPMNTATFTGANPRNPYVDPAFVKQIYDKFFDQQ